MTKLEKANLYVYCLIAASKIKKDATYEELIKIANDIFDKSLKI